MIFDPLYIALVLPAILLAMWAQFRVSSAFRKYSRMANSSNISGAQAAQGILRSAGITDVEVETASGWLSDHYDPRSKKLRLSSTVFQGRSVAAVGIAAHEAGHALQHASHYAPLVIRSAMVPVASFGSNTAYIFILLGFLIGHFALVKVGILLFGVAVIFSIVTLPVEFNASRRAKLALRDSGIITAPAEIRGVNAVLGAAAMTYVAATVAAVAQLLYYVLRFRSDD